MNCVLVDVEWFDSYDGENNILQLSGIKCSKDKEVISEYHASIKPKNSKKYPKHLLHLLHTSIDEINEGIPIRKALADFYNWCGKDCIMIAWGNASIECLNRSILEYCENRPWKKTIDLQIVHWCNTEQIETVTSVSKACLLADIPMEKPEHISKNDVSNLLRLFKILDLHKMREPILVNGVDGILKSNVKKIESKKYAFFVYPTGKVFHTGECRFLLQNAKNKIKGFSSLAGVENLGYLPCKCCKPLEYIDKTIRKQKKAKQKSQLQIQISTDALFDLCERCRFLYNLVGNVLFIRTNFASWYFNIHDKRIVLYHESLRNRPTHSKFGSEYHMQEITFESPFCAIKYINSHDSKFR